MIIMIIMRSRAAGHTYCRHDRGVAPPCMPPLNRASGCHPGPTSGLGGSPYGLADLSPESCGVGGENGLKEARKKMRMKKNVTHFLPTNSQTMTHAHKIIGVFFPSSVASLM